jgi:hypothetical protein
MSDQGELFAPPVREHHEISPRLHEVVVWLRKNNQPVKRVSARQHRIRGRLFTSLELRHLAASIWARRQARSSVTLAPPCVDSRILVAASARTRKDPCAETSG